MEAQNGAHGCDCGKVKVTLLNKRNAAEALTAPLDGTEHRCSQMAAPRTLSPLTATANFSKLSAGESPPRCGQQWGNSWTRSKLSTLGYTTPFCEK